jgi:hypothetical protein
VFPDNHDGQGSKNNAAPVVASSPPLFPYAALSNPSKLSKASRRALSPKLSTLVPPERCIMGMIIMYGTAALLTPQPPKDLVFKYLAARARAEKDLYGLDLVADVLRARAKM